MGALALPEGKAVNVSSTLNLRSAARHLGGHGSHRKTVIHGGAERQSRSDCEVVPMSGLAGVLDSFER